VLSFHRRVWLGPLLLGLAAPLPAAEPLSADAYVQIVLRAHPGVRQVAALQAAAAAERKAGRVFPDPVASFFWGRATADGGARGDEHGFSIAQTIPWPGTFRAAGQAGDRAGDVLGADAVAARWDLEIEARGAFARLLYARAALTVAQEAEADAQTLRDLTRTRAELGEAREADRIKAEVEWLRQQRSRQSLERQAEAAEAVLRALAVEPLPQPLDVAGRLPGAVPPVDLAELEARMARDNPRLASARAAAAREEALASVSRRGRVPDLDMSWFRDRELDKQTNGVSLGVRVPVWGANRGQIARAEAAAALAAATAERVQLDLATGLARARQELEAASGQADILERQILPAAGSSLELARFSYREGETSLLDLLDAQRTYRETQSEALASRLAVALALGEVQRLVGPEFDPGRNAR
jgi:cobalt-zinc-cadmium efflux system outer membrane protein